MFNKINTQKRDKVIWNYKYCSRYALNPFPIPPPIRNKKTKHHINPTITLPSSLLAMLQNTPY